MINMKQLCAAIDAYAFLQTGLRKTGQFKSYRPVAMQKYQDGMYVYIPLKLRQTSIEKPVETFADAFLHLSPVDGTRIVSELSTAIREIPVVEHGPYGKCLKIDLTQGDISAAACVTDWNKVLPAEILRAFDDCYSKKQALKIATIASLEDVDTKFKTDEYNLIVAADGTYYDMTPVDHRELVRKGYSEALDETGSAMRLADFSDNVILTDATNNKLVVSNTMGYIVGLDMSGYRPFSLVSARQLLRDTYISYNDVTGPYYSDISTALEEADRKIANTTWASWFTMLVNTPTVAISQVQNKLEAYWTDLLAKTQEDLHMSYYQYLCTFRPLVKSLLYYGKKIPAYDTAKNLREESAFDCDVSNLPGVQGYMPHQVDVLSKTKNSKLNVLQVGTGGGKSLITITDISNKLKSGQIKKPLVIMPTKLLGQYASEIFNFSENNLNCFVYGRDTAASYKKAYDMKRDAIENADKNLPPNTIYLVGYDLLKSSKDFAGNSYTKSYLGQEQDTFPIADYLAKQGFDAIYLDEAHKIKNESGRLSRIVRSILTGVDYITCMSGTLIYNNVKDLQSIVSICAPEASRYDYEAKGYLNAMSDLDIKFIAKEQKDWAAFLPKFKDYLVPVRLPESYAEAYKNAEQEIMTQIINDPTLAEYKDYLSGESDVELDEDAEEKIQFIMNMRFNKLETIINAPDKAGFNAVSPKVKAFDDIIDAHEAHGSYANIDFSKSGDKKIFAFGYNKNVSEHVYNHSKHKDIICWYHGDKTAITQFLTDPKKRVLLADITSIAEGWNFQLCDTCVPGHTRVLIDEHTAVPIKDIYDNPEITHVLGYDLESKKIKKYKILDKSKRLLKPEDNTVRIEYVDSRTGKTGNATFTGNHKIYTKNRGYVRADEITNKDILVTFGGKFEDMRVYNGEILSSEDEGDCRKKSAERLKRTKARLESFVNNHYLVVNRVVHNVNFRDKYKYDLTIDKVHNFFVAGHKNQPVMLVHNCINLQSLFTPGQTQQAIARVFRPKIGDASRPVVNNITISVNNTVDMVKFARLLYKKCMVNSVYYANDSAYNTMALNYGLNKLPRVSLSMKSITEYEDDASLNRMGFFTAATALNDWNSRIIDLSKAKLIKDAADRLGKSPADVDLAKDILIPATHNAQDIAGSQKVWTAKPVGFSPKSNALTLEQAIANLLSDFTGPESEEKSVIKNALQGTRVITAFGPGIVYRVATARSKPASTITIGSNNIVLANSEVFIDDDSVGNAVLQQMLQAKPTKPVIPVKELHDELTDEDISDDLENDDSGLDIYPGIVNNQAALVDTNGYKLDGFVELGPILYSKIKNKSTISKILDFMTNTSDYDFEQPTIDELEKLRQRMINQAKSYATESKMYPKIKKWARLQKLPSKTKALEPFIVYVDDEAMFCISLKHSRHARKLIGKKFASGMTPFKAQSNFAVLFAKGPNTLAKALKKIEEGYSLNNAQETYDLAAKVKVKSKI